MSRIILSILLILICSCSTLSKKDVLLYAGSSATALLDAYSTNKALDNGRYELNPVVGKHPSKTTVFLVACTSQVVVMIVTYFLPEKYRHIILGGKIVVNGSTTVNNFLGD